jgi:hypothetical protein
MDTCSILPRPGGYTATVHSVECLLVQHATWDSIELKNQNNSTANSQIDGWLQDWDSINFCGYLKLNDVTALSWTAKWGGWSCSLLYAFFARRAWNACILDGYWLTFVRKSLHRCYPKYVLYNLLQPTLLSRVWVTIDGVLDNWIYLPVTGRN